MKEKTAEEKRAHYIRTAGVISLCGNLALAAVKLTFAVLASSLALLGDAVDSATDVVISIVTLIIAGVIAKPGDKEHPWGHARAETVATMILAFIIFLAGSELVISAVKKLIVKDASEGIAPVAVIAALISIAGKSFLALSQYTLGKKANSDIVKANAQNMRNDIVLSLAVLLGLAASILFKCPILDPLVAILVGLWVIKNAVELFKDLNMELMDGNTDSSLYKKLFEAASSVEGVTNPHRARIRKLSSLWDISLDIEVNPSMTIFEAHEKAEQVEEAIKKAIPDVYDIMVHVEPEGSDQHQPEERFGLSPEHL